MALSVHRARPKYAAALLSPSCLHKLRVPAEFAARLGGEEVVVLLVSLLGKVWRAELRRKVGDHGAWQLADGWPEFVAAHGVGAGWSVVFRIECRGVATVRAFDAAGCLVRFCTPLAGVVVKNRPRFIMLLHPEDLEKMKMPDEFVQEHLSESSPSSRKAIVFSRLGKFWHVELERDKPGMLRLQGDGWALYLTAHGVSEGNILVFRYEGNMVFTVEVFLQGGPLKLYGTAAADITDYVVGPSVPQGAKQSGVSPVKMKRKNTNENAYVKGSERKSKLSKVSVNKVASNKKLSSIVPQHSFTKRITGYNLKSYLAVKKTFCSSVGLLGASEIRLKTSVDHIKSWLVSFNTANTYGYIGGAGWKKFCQENKIEEGSCCTFNVVETRFWLVTVTSG